MVKMSCTFVFEVYPRAREGVSLASYLFFMNCLKWKTEAAAMVAPLPMQRPPNAWPIVSVSVPFSGRFH